MLVGLLVVALGLHVATLVFLPGFDFAGVLSQAWRMDRFGASAQGATVDGWPKWQNSKAGRVPDEEHI